MKATDTRPLGRTGLPVSQIGFGAAPLGNLYESFPDRQAYETVRAAWDAGIRLYDTAPLYGFGLSEHRIGEALRWERRADYVLSTEIGRLLQCPGDVERNGRRLYARGDVRSLVVRRIGCCNRVLWRIFAVLPVHRCLP